MKYHGNDLKDFINKNTNLENNVINFGSKIFTTFEYENVLNYIFGRKQKLKNKTKQDQKIIENFLDQLVELVRESIYKVERRDSILEQSKNLIPAQAYRGKNGIDKDYFGHTYLNCSRNWNKSWGVCYYR